MQLSFLPPSCPATTEAPGLWRDPIWTYSFLEREHSWIPGLIQPMWTCFLMLWRLKELAPEGDDNEDKEVWKAYMLAWIVSSFSMSCLF